MQLTEEHFRDPKFRRSLRPKHRPYNYRIAVGRLLGYRTWGKGPRSWAAVLLKRNGTYSETEIGLVDDFQQADGETVLTFEQALEKAKEFFSRPEIHKLTKATRFNGRCEELIICPVGPDYTIGHVIAEYIDWKRLFGTHGSWSGSLYLCNAYILPMLANLPVRGLKSQHLRDLLKDVESTVPKRGETARYYPRVDPRTMSEEFRRKRRVTANHVFSILRTALNIAFEDGKIDDDRVWRRVKRFKDVAMSRPHILDHEQCIQLLQVSSPELQRMILAALYTGCRIGELLRIRKEDLERHRMAIYIRPFKVYRARYVALPEEGYHFFRQLGEGVNSKDILIKRDNGSEWHYNLPGQYLKKSLEKAGLPLEFVFHSLRHTYASFLIQSGTAPIVVSRQLGHKNLAAVVRTYAHCADDFIDHEVRKRYKPEFLAAVTDHALDKTHCEGAKTNVVSIDGVQR